MMLRARIAAIVASLTGIAGQAIAQPTPTPPVTDDVSREALPGAASIITGAERAHGTATRAVGAMLKRRDACVAAARAGALGPKTSTGAMAQYRCLIAGTGAGVVVPQAPASAPGQRR